MKLSKRVRRPGNRPGREVGAGATILTVDPAPTSPPGRPVATNDATVYEPAKPIPPPVKPPVPAATVAEPAPSIVTVPQAPKPAPQITPVAPPSKSKAGLLIAVAVVLLLIGGAGVGGFLIWNKTRSTANPAGTANTNTAAPETAPREITRYWLELEPAVA